MMDTITEKSKTSVAKFEDFFSTEYKGAIFEGLEKYPDERSVVVDYLQLEMFDPDLADLLIEKPEEVIKAAQKAIKNIDTTRKNADLNVRFQNLSNIIPLRDLRSKYIGKFVAVDGIIRKTNEIRPRIVNAMFECRSCMRLHEVSQKSNLVSEPALCNDCGRRSFRLLQEESEFLDTQTTRLQEPLENLSGGEQPRQINVVLEDDLVDTTTPGDIIRITGTLKTVRDEKTKLFKNYIYCNYIEALEQEFEELQISEEDEEKIKKLAKNPDVYNKIINSTAPSIQGYREVKEAIALQLFGGVAKELEDRTRIRGDIHILIVGDPGIGKSQMLKYVSKLAPRGIYTSGKGTSGVGLCIAPESLIFTEDGAFEIAEFINKNLTNPIEYKEGIFVSKLKNPIKIQTINSTKLSSKISDKIWKLKAPEKLAKITTQTGKELILTQETKVLCYQNSKNFDRPEIQSQQTRSVCGPKIGACKHEVFGAPKSEILRDFEGISDGCQNGELRWREARELEKNNYVATTRKLQHKGQNILTLELIKDLDNVNVFGAKSLLKKLIKKIKKNKGFRELAQELEVNENSLYYDYTNKNARSYINLKLLLKLAVKANYSLEKLSDKIQDFSQYRGHSIKLPKYLNERFLYFAGLIAGDGDIRVTPTGGHSIRFSQGDKEFREKYKSLISELFGLQPKEIFQKDRVPVVRFHSKIIAHILNLLGIPESPKSNRLDISKTMFSLPNKELAAFIRGLFDCDGSVMINYTGSSSIEFFSASEKLAKKLQLALLRFGIVAHIRKREVKGQITEIRGRKVIKRNDQYVIRISGENIEKFATLIGFEHPKKKNKLQELLNKRRKQKIDTNIDIIPGVGQTINEIRSFYGLSIKETYGSNFGHLVEKGNGISRKFFQKVIKYLKSKASIENIKIELPDEIRLRIGKLLNHKELKLNEMAFYDYFKRKGRSLKVPFNVLIEATNRIKDKKLHTSLICILSELQAREVMIREKIQYLESLSYSDILFEKIKKIEIIDSPYDYVYDLTVEKSHSFIANGIVVHNTAAAVKDDLGGWSLEAGALVLGDRGNVCVDELDKMRPEDRSAIHEALEQQSYHKDFEILLANGRKVKIGDFVDKLIKQKRNEVVYGKDTEILMTDDFQVMAYDLENLKIVPVTADRISRHKAPDNFVKMEFENGRNIIVTPEHPTVIWDGDIKTVRADEIKEDMFLLGVNTYEISANGSIDSNIAKFLGFVLSEGYTYKNENNYQYEIGFTNTDEKLIEEFKIILEEQKIKYGVSIREKEGWKTLYTVRITSKEFYHNLLNEFPEVFLRSEGIRPARMKRVPNKIMMSSENNKNTFLNAYFKGDGFVDNYRTGYSTSSVKMAEDLQDLLLMYGIHSYIFREEREEGIYYKVTVSGKGNMEKFAEIIKDDPRTERVRDLINTSANKNNDRDILPDEIVQRLDNILKKLRICDGRLCNNINRGQNTHRLTLNNYVKKSEKLLEEISISLQNKDVNGAKKIFRISELSLKLNVPYSTLRYRLMNGDEEIIKILLNEANERFIKVREDLKLIKKYVQGNVRFVKVKKVELVENTESKWVYDITVEPQHLFVSHGLVLHNTISIAKAGIMATLNSRCAMLAAANPKFGRFDRYKSIAEQINLPAPILSRFDLIFIVEDKPNAEKDRKLAGHILNIHKNTSIPFEIDPELLRKYIAYARKQAHPQLTQGAIEVLQEFYVGMRGSAEDDDSPVPITARQLEALVRLSEANCKIRLGKEVTAEDAKRAIKLQQECMKQVGLDPETGKVDIDKVEGRTPKSERDKALVLMDIIKELGDEYGGRVPVSILTDEMSDRYSVSEDKVLEIINKLKQQGLVFEPQAGYLKTV